MDLTYAKELATKYRDIIVRSKSGCEYSVAWDTITESDCGYVYGTRINAPAHRGWRRNAAVAGSIKWFDLANMELVSTGDPLDPKVLKIHGLL